MLLGRCATDGDRVVIFSRSVMMLDILQKYLEAKVRAHIARRCQHFKSRAFLVAMFLTYLFISSTANAFSANGWEDGCDGSPEAGGPVPTGALSPSHHAVELSLVAVTCWTHD